jgi:hypothetical protein
MVGGDDTNYYGGYRESVLLSIVEDVAGWRRLVLLDRA